MAFVPAMRGLIVDAVVAESKDVRGVVLDIVFFQDERVI